MSYYGNITGITSPTTDGNSTTTPLSSGATFTGTWEQNNLPEVMVSCTTDNSGTLYFDFSVDGTNVSTFPVSGFAVSSGIHEFHVAVKGPRYFRARLVNDTGAQSYLRLSTYYGTDFTRPNAPTNQSVSRHTDATLVRVYADPQDEIVLDQRTGVFHYTKFAYLPDIDTGDGETFITANPTKTAAPEILTTAETFSIAYDDVNDGSAGTGATQLFIDYIDADGVDQTATHTLGSSSPDTTAFSGLGINRCAVSASSTNDTNEAAITFTSSTTGGVHAYLPADQGVTQQAVFHVPSNAKGVAKLLFFNANKIGGGSEPKVTVKGWIHNRLIDTKYEIFRYIMDVSVENHLELTDPIGFALSAGDVLYFTAETTVNNTVVGAMRFSLNVYENN